MKLCFFFQPVFFWMKLCFFFNLYKRLLEVVVVVRKLGPDQLHEGVFLLGRERKGPSPVLET